MMSGETTRQIVHIVMIAFALVLRYVTWPFAVALGAAALTFNIFVFPIVAPRLLREPDRRGWSGIRFYPLAVLLLALVFRSRLDLVAAAWAIMAVGDGSATLAGRHWPSARLPWNADKTWAGFVAFLITGSLAAVAFGAWVAAGLVSRPDPLFTLWAGIAAAVCAAVVETVPIRLDDNLSVPAAAAATLALATLVDASAFAAAWPLVAERLPVAIVVNVIMAAAVVMARAMTLTGGVIGTLLGIVIYAGGGGAAWLVLGMAFALAVLTSELGRARKVAAGIAEGRGGRRGAGNAIANCLVGAIGAALIVTRPDEALGALVMVTGLTAGASDTVASEIGKAFGGTPRTVPMWRRVAAGTPGGVSVIGTMAGVVAAALMAWSAVLLDVAGFTAPMIGPVVVGATVGAFAESLLAGWFEPQGIVNNDVLNVITTVVASLVAVALA